MEPEPSPETIVQAELIDDEPTYEVNLKKNNEINITEIQLFIREKTNQIVYEKIIVKDSDFWNKIKSKFQNNFDIFYVVLESALIKKTNENLSSEIIIENFNLKLELHYTSELFGFKINMFLTKQKEKIDILKEENNHLKMKLESLEQKIQSLENVLDSKFTFIEKIESLCKIVDMMGPQYMRNSLTTMKLHTNMLYPKPESLGTSGGVLESKLGHPVYLYKNPIEAIDIINRSENDSCYSKFVSINKNKIEYNNTGGGPRNIDTMLWSKTAWELIKKDKQWNID